MKINFHSLLVISIAALQLIQMIINNPIRHEEEETT